MPHSEPPNVPSGTSHGKADWRSGLALAWVLWFGLLYARTVMESRGAAIRTWILGEVYAEDARGRPLSR
ncbi:MAG: hypothetical protein AB7I30_24210 [Isosphaeraceae bacterium]